MKKALFPLILALALTLTACGTPSPANVSPSATPEASPPSVSASSDAGIAVHVPTVAVITRAELLNEMDTLLASNGYSLSDICQKQSPNPDMPDATVWRCAPSNDISLTINTAGDTDQVANLYIMLTATQDAAQAKEFASIFGSVVSTLDSDNFDKVGNDLQISDNSTENPMRTSYTAAANYSYMLDSSFSEIVVTLN